jgi:flagellar biosynthesis/type III secretory pathway protein FliH
MTPALAEPKAAPLGRILRADEVRLYRDAATALRNAEVEAREYRTAAMRDAERARADLLATARQETEREITRILVATAAEARRRLALLPMEIATAIAEGIAKVISGVDLAEAVARAAQKALAELTERHSVVIRVNPLAEVRTRAALANHVLIRVLADQGLASDDCILETPAGFVHAGLSAQIETLRAALLAAAAEHE